MLSGYSDSDLAGEVDDSKSTRGMVFYLNENLPAGYLINNVVWLYHLVKLSSWQLQQLHVKVYGYAR